MQKITAAWPNTEEPNEADLRLLNGGNSEKRGVSRAMPDNGRSGPGTPLVPGSSLEVPIRIRCVI